MAKLRQIRQGDVLLVPVSKQAIPKKTTKRSSGILAYGEVTGHSHALADPAAAAVLSSNGNLFLKVTASEGAVIKHQEHGPVTVPPGEYEVRIQQEWTPEQMRNVRD